MKEVKMRRFTIYYMEGEEKKDADVTAVDFATAIEAKFGGKLPNITQLYSYDTTVYLPE